MALACQLLYVPVCVFTKISLLITYLREFCFPKFTLPSLADSAQGIFPGKTNKWFCYTLMVYEVAWGVASFFASLFQCAPVQSYWLIQSPVRDCVNVSALYYSTSGLNIFTDCTSPHQLRSKQVITLTSEYSSSHLPLASQRPRFRSDFRSSTHHPDHHVLSWRDHLRGGPLPRLVHLYLRQILGLSM
jgi:hypothetical protein